MNKLYLKLLVNIFAPPQKKIPSDNNKIKTIGFCTLKTPYIAATQTIDL